ncbi:sigma-70 family RNA polymerase sigma factor [Streptomyces sp. NBC_01142]|uniref:sigma-70 family RNA polymerase sigma factor n=1 Tax=Streptomyces sp. NBC_01142 TaxID=2975865 RepID=UPI00224FE15D|nr:sigma-70 family RNA polymerase sigma factor [Streptomyces sp. NBC_01142]MCX4826143.1 sigma-70 family RNA polymerase sigma factor [Streptomyces sp. NBC_01142]
MTTALRTTTLTADQRRAAARFVYGVTNQAIAGQVCLSVDGVASHLSAVRKKMGCPGSSRAVLVHTLLTAREVPPPASSGPVPAFTNHEMTAIRAIAEHTRNADIGNAIGVPADDVRAEIDAVVAKASARSAAHLVGLAHAWGLLGDASNSQPATAATATAEPVR